MPTHRLIASIVLVTALLGAGAQAHAGSRLTVIVTVTPTTMRYDAKATAVIQSEPGATCLVNVRYADGRMPTSWIHKYGRARVFTVPRSGKLRFTWREETKSATGVVSAGCETSATSTASGYAVFTVLHAGSTRTGSSSPDQQQPASTATTVPTAPATSTPVPTATMQPTQATQLSVSVAVSPNPIPYGAYPTVSVHTAPAAICSISVTYDTGRHPTSYPAHTATADASGTITESGQWHMESKGGSGQVDVACGVGSASATGIADFTID